MISYRRHSSTLLSEEEPGPGNPLSGPPIHITPIGKEVMARSTGQADSRGKGGF